ncbi:HEPN domain-containing protein [Aphanizomenon flos-aquae NRERC-008]|jgi:hypothetical protein|uniref:RiboL-PSP-HEPN domain-containing protein n=2 Tax=Aphanizomenon flos-aquae TaxID=1176 RepID=A0ABR8IKQ2_APHFL|nr:MULTISPECIES: HEPN domain-containing protein [Aphanizomenon]MBD1218713.1 hypothetical protein [Aphanizomenon flos-aquae Clear-A1]MBO1061348.1 hypothetical protein [Aphanizomenon flos-aquae CP01]MBO1072172.1 hypothetical protein [Dolichospermum sp. DEX189]QSV66278.1 MAG: hypothetical protein HEQ12_04475 [Aphanizomenon flos-aquae DEX188]MBD2391094.1 hypothetical protein [Aphanizomenon flos-aquae FACHB-1171]
MRKHSESYFKLKSQIQESLDFIILCCYAVPSLNAYMKAVELGNGKPDKLPDPDHFKKNPEYENADHSRLKEIKPNYQKTLGKLLLISSFTYFEYYISNVIEEFFDLNGGRENFKSLLKSKIDRKISDYEDTNNLVKKLKEPKKPSKLGKYEKAINELQQTNYSFPSQLLCYFGLIELQGKFKKDKNIEARDILKILKDAFHVEITEKEASEFTKIQEKRNRIVHGGNTEINLAEALQFNDFLKDLAQKVDQHLLKTFFILEFITKD